MEAQERFCISCHVLIAHRRVLSQPRIKFCSVSCMQKYEAEHYKLKNPRLNLPTSTVGAISELYIATDLLKQGWAVFRALSPSCPCDLVIMRNDQVLKVEVKTIHFKKNGEPLIPKARTNEFDILALYHIGTNKIIYTPAIPSSVQGSLQRGN